MGVRIQELPETTGINKEDVLIVEDGQGTKKGTVQQLDEALGVSQLKEDLVNSIDLYELDDLCTISGYINKSDGRSIEHDYYKHSDYIDIRENVITSIKLHGNNNIATIAYYDSVKKFISSESGTLIETFTIPTLAKYVIITSVYPYSKDDYISVVRNTLKTVNSKLDEYGTLDYTSFPLSNGYYDANGRIVPHDYIKYTSLINLKLFPIKEINLYGRTSNVSTVVYFDFQKKYISNEMHGTLTQLTIPENAEYYAFSIEGKYNILTFENLTKNVALFVDDNVQKKVDIPLGTILTDGGFTKIFRTIGVVGDSLSSGEMAYGDATDESTTKYVDMYEYSWIQYMARYCGSTAHNFSRGGLSTRTFFSDSSYTKMMDSAYKCQAYFIALGHNDYNQGVPIGSSADIHIDNPDANADTYYGNYAKIISKIKTVSPKAKIFCIGMKHKGFKQYNDVIEYMQTIFDNVYFLNMNKYNSNYESWEDTQGHGNAMGYLNYSYQISSYVDWIIKNNRDDFKYVQFINTDKEQYIPNNS